jgi:predicted nucleic acid-binding protein
MYNALEVFRLAKSEAEREVVKNMLSVVRVLGFNYRYAEQFALIVREIEDISKTEITEREALIIGMAKTSKLTILTRDYYDRYTSLHGVDVASGAMTVPS